MSGEVQNKGGEYVTFNDLKNYVETEMAEYIRRKGKNEQAPYAKGDYTGDFLLAVGRPEKEVRVDAVQYRSKSGDRVDSKRIYDSKGRKQRLSFHNISDDGNIYPASLDGISQTVFKYNDKCFLPPAFPPAPHEGSREGRDCFEAHQFDRQGNLDFRHAVRYDTGCMQCIPNKKECITVSDTLDIRARPTLYPKERTVVHYDENCLRSGKSSRECKSLEEFYRR